MVKCTINGKSAALNLNNEQLQVLISGKFGDGYLCTPKTAKSNSKFETNCIYKEYIEFKKDLLGDQLLILLQELIKDLKIIQSIS